MTTRSDSATSQDLRDQVAQLEALTGELRATLDEVQRESSKRGDLLAKLEDALGTIAKTTSDDNAREFAEDALALLHGS